MCEGNGHITGKSCSRSKFECQTFSVIFIISSTMGTCYPLILIVTFILRKKDIKIVLEKMKSISRRLKNTKETDEINIPYNLYQQ